MPSTRLHCMVKFSLLPVSPSSHLGHRIFAGEYADLYIGDQVRRCLFVLAVDSADIGLLLSSTGQGIPITRLAFWGNAQVKTHFIAAPLVHFIASYRMIHSYLQQAKAIGTDHQRCTFIGHGTELEWRPLVVVLTAHAGQIPGLCNDQQQVLRCH